MRSAQFWPGVRVMVLGNDEGIQPGTVGVVNSRWRGPVYAIRTKDGSFHWVDSTDIDAINPERHRIVAGDIVEIKSNEHNHSFIQIGDFVQVLKVMDDMDYYKVLLNDGFYWLANFELAPYFPPEPL